LSIALLEQRMESTYFSDEMGRLAEWPFEHKHQATALFAKTGQGFHKMQKCFRLQIIIQYNFSIYLVQLGEKKIIANNNHYIC
jgi:hypothetical protein